MRLWSLHPQYLDTQGLLAAWREGLLAQKVLLGETRGYRHHPQLERFRQAPDPTAAIAAFLLGIHAEACKRHYRFDENRIRIAAWPGTLPLNAGQLQYEWQHLLQKLANRDPARHEVLRELASPLPHPLFHLVPGPVADWESPASNSPD